MNTPEAKIVIIGTTTLTQGDNVSFTMRPMVITLVLLFLLLVGLKLYYYSASGIASIWTDPMQAIFLIVVDDWQQSLQIFSGFLAFMLLMSAVQWIRLPSQNKIVSYLADETGLTTTDAAGASLQIPWSMVKRASKTQKHLIMKMKAGNRRFAPWRAFSPVDADKLWSLVQLKTRTD
ncbi:YcxB family protein [Rhizobium sp. 32-5/1]|uniref:YcxB family protein n=1 Tax=Rhizobium sp. 32-5/1 TaxID=3019602 RepID=UPI00240E61C7|nr:YcxB family protein [Rhizobium sp. 32-5/1]WEZ84080.1 YcxB family protein [Rhizobium sp. 32-5/1]